MRYAGIYIHLLRQRMPISNTVLVSIWIHLLRQRTIAITATLHDATVAQTETLVMIHATVNMRASTNVSSNRCFCKLLHVITHSMHEVYVYVTPLFIIYALVHACQSHAWLSHPPLLQREPRLRLLRALRLWRSDKPLRWRRSASLFTHGFALFWMWRGCMDLDDGFVHGRGIASAPTLFAEGFVF